jgi:hypothetical protein
MYVKKKKTKKKKRNERTTCEYTNRPSCVRAVYSYKKKKKYRRKAKVELPEMCVCSNTVHFVSLLFSSPFLKYIATKRTLVNKQIILDAHRAIFRPKRSGASLCVQQSTQAYITRLKKNTHRSVPILLFVWSPPLHHPSLPEAGEKKCA